METLVNAQVTDSAKRKAEEDGDRPKKVSRLEQASIIPSHRPTTPRRPREHLAPLTTPDHNHVAPPIPIPTPARDILRRGIDEDESIRPTSSPPKNLIFRPPTPPRPHIQPDTNEEIDKKSYAAKRRLSPDMLPDRRPTKLSSIRRLDFTTIASAGPSPRRPLGPVRPLNLASQQSTAVLVPETLRPPVAPDSAFPSLGPDPPIADTQTPFSRTNATTARLDPSNSPELSASTLGPPPSPAMVASPRRVMAGISRLGLSAPSQSPIPIPSFTSDATLKASIKHKVPPDPASLYSDEAPVTYPSGSISVPADTESMRCESSSKPAEVDGQAVHGRLDVVQENIEMNVSTIVEPPAESRPIRPAPIALPKSTSTRTLNVMGPPSRIPTGIKSSRPSSATSRLSAVLPITEIPVSVSNLSKPAASVSGLPRPTVSSSTASSLGKGLPSSTMTNAKPIEASMIRRKPSYPSSLGSGPLARPTQRMVSNPVLPPRPPSTEDMEFDDSPKPRQSPRSVSAPVDTSRLSMSSSRREGLSFETSQRVNGLSEALEKLKMKKAESSTRLSLASSASRRTLASSTSQITQPRHSMTASTSMRMSAVHRPRHSLATLAADITMTSESAEAGDRSLAAIMCSTSGGGCLKGVAAFIDVRTEEGADSSAIFGDILRSLGAKVSTYRVVVFLG